MQASRLPYPVLLNRFGSGRLRERHRCRYCRQFHDLAVVRPGLHNGTCRLIAVVERRFRGLELQHQLVHPLRKQPTHLREQSLQLFRCCAAGGLALTGQRALADDVANERAGFNPRPALASGATNSTPGNAWITNVSIRAPLLRAGRHNATSRPPGFRKFQSAPRSCERGDVFQFFYLPLVGAVSIRAPLLRAGRHAQSGPR